MCIYFHAGGVTVLQFPSLLRLIHMNHNMLISSENFYDLNCVPSGRAHGGYQYISPNLTFPCDGVVTKWKIGTENENDDQVYLQIWRPFGADYSRVAETVYTHSGGQAIAEVTTDMTVSAGDMIGFFTPRNTPGKNVGLRLAWAPIPDYTLLQGVRRSAVGETPVATFTGSPTTLSSSPLVSVMFGKCTRLCGVSCALSLCMHASLYVYILVVVYYFLYICCSVLTTHAQFD